MGRQTHGTRHDGRGAAYARSSHAFPSWAYGNTADGKAERARKTRHTSLVFGGGRCAFTLAHMWRRSPERRCVKCERTLSSSILQIAESIIRALTHTDGGSGPNGNCRKSSAGRFIEDYVCDDMFAIIFSYRYKILLIIKCCEYHAAASLLQQFLKGRGKVFN